MDGYQNSDTTTSEMKKRVMRMKEKLINSLTKIRITHIQLI